MTHDFKTGDTVHIGFAVRGGAGFKGKLIKIERGEAHVLVGTGKFGDRVVKGPVAYLSHTED